MRSPIVKLPLWRSFLSLLPVLLATGWAVAAIAPGQATVLSPLTAFRSDGDRVASDNDGVIAPQQHGWPARLTSAMPATEAGDDRGDRGGLSLRLSTGLSAHLLGVTPDSKRVQLRMESRLAAALYAQAQQQLAVAAQLRQIDTALAALRAKAEQHANLAEEIGAALPTRAALTASPTGSGQAHGQLSPSIPLIGNAPAADKTDWWPETAFLLALIAFLVWLFRRLAGRRSPLPAVVVAGKPARETSPGTGPKTQDSSSVRALTVGNGAPLAKALPTPTAGVAQPEPALAPVKGGADEVRRVLELAEVMFAFGHIEAAAPALAEFVERHPLAAVTPWLKLLEVYRRTEQRDAFEALGAELRRYFNVDRADWEAAGDSAQSSISLGDRPIESLDQLLPCLPAIGQLPHLVTEISRTWDSPECLAYLNKLLRDNRDGARKGFALGTVHELLILIDFVERTATRSR